MKKKNIVTYWEDAMGEERTARIGPNSHVHCFNLKLIVQLDDSSISFAYRHLLHADVGSDPTLLLCCYNPDPDSGSDPNPG